MRLVLIGIAGSGKSASANTILGEKRFHSKAIASSVTATCKVEHKTRFGHDIVIVNTPGPFDTERSQEEITKEIRKCIEMCPPGPHAFIMVLKANRFTPEKQDAIQYFEDIFGEKIYDYMFLLFTFIDDLEEDGQNLEEFLAKAPENLKHLIDKCGGRFFGFNNREKDKKKREEMAKQLIDMIKVNVDRNGGTCYTSAFMEAADKVVKKHEEHESRKLEEKLKNEYLEELRVQARHEVRKEAETNQSVLDFIGNVVSGVWGSVRYGWNKVANQTRFSKMLDKRETM